MSVDAHIMIDAVAREKLEMQILLSGFNDIKRLVALRLSSLGGAKTGKNVWECLSCSWLSCCHLFEMLIPLQSLHNRRKHK